MSQDEAAADEPAEKTTEKAPARKAPARKRTAKTSSARKASAKKTSAKTTPAKTTPAKKAPVRKASARKAPATKSAPEPADDQAYEAADDAADETRDDSPGAHGPDDQRADHQDGDPDDRDSGRRRPAGRTAAATAEAPRRQGAGGIARQAAAQLYDLTGYEIEGITGVHRDDDGWVVEIDVLELRRIPATTDVLATYEVEMDASGEMMGYRRCHRFVRGSVGDDR